MIVKWNGTNRRWFVNNNKLSGKDRYNFMFKRDSHQEE